MLSCDIAGGLSSREHCELRSSSIVCLHAPSLFTQCTPRGSHAASYANEIKVASFCIPVYTNSVQDVSSEKQDRGCNACIVTSLQHYMISASSPYPQPTNE